MKKILSILLTVLMILTFSNQLIVAYATVTVFEPFPASEFKYVINDNGTDDEADDTVTITGLKTSENTLSNLVFPQKIEDKPVTKIKGINNLFIATIYIPEGVTTIEDCFYSTKAISNIILPKSLTTVDADLMYDSPNNKKTSVYYNGTINDFVDINFSSERSNLTRLGAFYIKPTNQNNEKADSDETVKFDDESYELLSNKHLKEITKNKIKDYMFCDANLKGSLDLPNNIKYIGKYAFCDNTIDELVLHEGLIEINEGAFYNCKKLKSVNLPKTLNKIGSMAFYNCTSLNDVNYNSTLNNWVNIDFDHPEYKGNRVYDNSEGTNPCEYAKKINTIDNSSETIIDSENIKKWSLEEISNITKIILTKNVKNIDASSFVELKNIEEYMVEKENEFYSSLDGVLYNKKQDVLINYPSAKYCETFIVKDTVTEIKPLAFHNSFKIKNIIIGDHVKKIGGDCFGRCDALQSLTLPFVGSQKDSEDGFNFHYDGIGISSTNSHVIPKSLKTVEIKNSYDEYEICKRAFEGCHQVETIKLNCNVTKLGSESFSYCGDLKSIGTKYNDAGLFLNNSLTEIGANAFMGCSGLITVKIPDRVKSIGDFAFENCENLESCVLPQNLEQVNRNLFACCKSLRTIDLPQKVSYIGEYAFEDCENLTNVNISGNNLSNIKTYAFKGCSALESINLNNVKSQIEDYAFENCENLKKIELSDTLKSVGTNCFNGCIGVTDIIINGPTNFASYSLSIPKKLHSVIINNEKVTNLYNALTRYSDGGAIIDYGKGEFMTENYKVPITLDGWEEIIPFENGIITSGSTGIDSNVHYEDKTGKIDWEYNTKHKIKSIIFEDDIISIGDNRIINQPLVENLVLPNTLESIGNNFLSVNLNDNECNNFENKITDIILPKTLKTIGESLFANRKLNNLSIPAGLEKIEINISNPIDTNLFICSVPKEYQKKCSKGLLKLVSQSFYTNLENIDWLTFPVTNKLTEQGSVFIGNRTQTINSKAFDYSLSNKSSLNSLISFNKNFYFSLGNFDSILKSNIGTVYVYKDSKLNQLYFDSQADNIQNIKYLYDITYDTCGGDFEDSEFEPNKVYIENEEIDLSPNVYKDGKVFIGWSNEPNGKVIDNIKAIQNTRLYAVYENAKYSITYEPNGGKGTMPSFGSNTKKDIKLLKNGFYKKGYTFIGWSKNKDAKTPDYTDEEVCSPFGLFETHLTLYAIWQENKPSVPDTIAITKIYDDKHPEDEPEFAENEGDDSADADLDIEQIKNVPETGDDMYLITIIFGLAGVSLVGAANVLIITSYRKKKNKNN